MKYLIALSLVMVLLLPAAAQADCINPAGKEGEVRFNDDYLVFQGCDGTDWQAFHDPHCPAGNGCPPPPSGCSNIGDTCDDGTIYAGLSPDGSVPMYTTPADAGIFSWNDNTTNYQDIATLENCTDISPGTASSCRTGEANTDLLINATGEPDYPFAAAEYCANLAPPDANAFGRDDWYLPAQDELNELYVNLADDGPSAVTPGNSFGFNRTSFPAGAYWSSSERFSMTARYQTFSDGSQGSVSKSSDIRVRCARKE